MAVASKGLSAAGLKKLRDCRDDAVRHVAEAFYADLGGAYARFGESGRHTCREDLAFHLDFLEPALEFGHAESFAAYLRWLKSVLEARRVPGGHLWLSVGLLAGFLAARLDADDNAVLREVLAAARNGLDGPDAKRAVPGEEAEVRAATKGTALREALLAGDRRAALNVLELAGA